jgi:hypothetical protein
MGVVTARARPETKLDPALAFWRLRRYRRNLQMSQEDLAASAGYERVFIGVLAIIANGELRPPGPRGRSGFLQVDTTHQGAAHRSTTASTTSPPSIRVPTVTDRGRRPAAQRTPSAAGPGDHARLVDCSFSWKRAAWASSATALCIRFTSVVTLESCCAHSQPMPALNLQAGEGLHTIEAVGIDPPFPIK